METLWSTGSDQKLDLEWYKCVKLMITKIAHQLSSDCLGFVCKKEELVGQGIKWGLDHSLNPNVYNN